MTNHIVSVSSGLSSAIIAQRVIERFPQAHLVFMDTKFEDDDNYRFLDEFEKYFNKTVTRITEGRTPYEISRAEHVIPSSLVAPCTKRLKLKPFRKWLVSNFQEAVIYIGYDYTEMHRMDATSRAYGELGFEVDYPLMWKPYEFRPYTQVSRDWGIEPPRMYRMGYTHANCGGRCVKQGQADWLRTLINFPERYRECEQWEQKMRQDFENCSRFAILKRTKGGETFPLTLKQLREEYEAIDGRMDLCSMDEQSPCVVCGVGL